MSHFTECIFLDCDFDLKPTETKFFGSKFKIHRGFLDRYKILRNEIISTINQLGDFSKPLILTGHSLGGVLAILTSLEMNLSYGNSSRAHKVISFGTPKFCCSKLVRNLSSNIIRVSNKNDPMVHIIPHDDFEVICLRIKKTRDLHIIFSILAMRLKLPDMTKRGFLCML